MADELAVDVHSRGRPVLRSSIDDFHTPGHKYRSIRREYTPESYIASGYDYVGFRRSMLDPLQTAAIDLQERTMEQRDDMRDTTNRFVASRKTSSRSSTGCCCFILCSSTRGTSPFGSTSTGTRCSRVARRDIAWVKSEEEVRWKYRNFWQPLHERYERTMRPNERCDVEIDNRDIAAPVVLRYSPASAT